MITILPNAWLPVWGDNVLPLRMSGHALFLPLWATDFRGKMQGVVDQPVVNLRIVLPPSSTTALEVHATSTQALYVSSVLPSANERMCYHCGKTCHWRAECPEQQHIPPSRTVGGVATEGVDRGYGTDETQASPEAPTPVPSNVLD